MKGKRLMSAQTTDLPNRDKSRDGDWGVARRLLRGLYRAILVCIVLSAVMAVIFGPLILISLTSQNWFWLLYVPHAVGLLFVLGENV